MFPHAVEVIEGVEEFIPSTIRLECFDREAVGFAQPLFAFCAVDTARLVVKAVDGTKYGEMGVAVRYYAVATCERRRNKSSPLRMALMMIPTSTLKLRSAGRVRRIITRFSVRVRLDDDGIWACPLPSCESFLKDWDLVFGPVH